MPQPDSSRHRTRWNEAAPWPVDPEAPRSSRSIRLASPPKEEPEKDGRTPDDRDGNQELEREQREQPPRRRDREAQARALEDLENEDTGQWVATERFTLDAELDDTLPNVPRYGSD